MISTYSQIKSILRVKEEVSLLWDEDTGAADILDLAFGFFWEKLGFDDEGLCRQVALSEHFEEAL